MSQNHPKKPNSQKYKDRMDAAKVKEAKAKAKTAMVKEQMEGEKLKEKKQERIVNLIKEIQNMKPATLIVASVVIVAVIVVCVIGIGSLFKEGERTVTTVAESSLEKIVSSSDLYTIEYTYNSVARVCEEDNETVKYYVAYEGVIKAGPDFSKIRIEEDKKENKIIIYTPEITVSSASIDDESLEFIFVKEKYNTMTVLGEALEKCKEDIEQKAGEDELIVEMARENAENFLRAFFEPWIEQMEDSYTVEIRWEE